MIEAKLQDLVARTPAIIQAAGGIGVYMGARGISELNLRGACFPGWAEPEECRRIAEQILPHVRKLRRYNWAFEAEMCSLPVEERYVLAERLQLSLPMSARQDGVHVLINQEQNAECYINDEEHLLIQEFFPKKTSNDEPLELAYKEMSGVLSALAHELPVAYDSTFGYLSSDPSKAGDALFFSALLHLPALRIARQMEDTQQALEDMRFYLTPVFSLSDHDRDEGDVYLLNTYGAPRGKIEQTLDAAITTINDLIHKELYARQKLQNASKSSAGVRRSISRAYESLISGKPMKRKDMLRNTSLLRLGIHCQYIKTETTDSETGTLLGEAYAYTAPAYMACASGMLKQSERIAARGKYMQTLMLHKLNASLHI